MADQTVSSQLQQLFDDEWEFHLKEDPLFATDVGQHRYDDRLPDVGEDAFQRRLAQARTFLDRLHQIDRAQLRPQDRLNYDIFERVKRDEIAEYEFHTYRMPIDRLGGFHASFADLPLQLALNTVVDYENYIARLNGFRAYAEQYIDLMRVGLRAGQMPAHAAVDGIERTVRDQIADDPTQSLLFKPFEKLPNTLGDGDQRRLIEAGRRAIEESVVPGYRLLLKFIVEEYMPAARIDIAAASLPNGREFYAHRVRLNTTLDLTPQQVHDMGLSEVKRIRAEMEAIIRRVNFDGDFRAFVNFLRTDPRFYVDTPDALMKETALILKKMDGELPRLFKTLPRTPCGIRPVPDYIAPYTAAYYMPPTGDGTRAGFFYVNTYDLKSRPLYELEALSLHEAVPGHHLQIALQQELEAMPNFRRFGGFTAFSEGWGLYAERLGLEAGFYQDPYSDFGRLTYEMWRACRLVVDTGMHALGWTRQQAIDFMTDHTASTALSIANEVDRYIAWPGQALAYKTGELKIRELRSLAERELGTAFDVREFHDVVLREGALPLSALETIIKNWIAAQK